MSDPTPIPAVRRERAIRLTVAASIGAKGFSVACTLVQVPLALHYLGTEAYGFWITLVTLVSVLNFVDFGLGVGMQHRMARAYGGDDMVAMRQVFWTGIAALALLGLVLLAIGLPAAFLGRWPDLLRIRDPLLRSETPAALAIALGAFVVGLPFNAVSRLGAALQRGWMNAGWIAAGSALSLALVAAAAFGRWGFLGFLAASLLVPALQGTGLFVHLLRNLGWDLRPGALAPLSEIRGMLRSSAYFAFPQFGLALIQSAPVLAISLAAGSSAVTGYNLLIRLFGPFQQLQVVALTPVWPAYTEAHTRGDHRWVTRKFWRTLAEAAALAAALALVALVSRPILRAWIGGTAGAGDRELTILAATWCILQLAAQPSIYYLTGVGRLRQLAWASTPGFAVSSLALFWSEGHGTAVGVLAGGCIAFGVTVLPPVLWQTIRSLSEHEHP